MSMPPPPPPPSSSSSLPVALLPSHRSVDPSLPLFASNDAHVKQPPPSLRMSNRALKDRLRFFVFNSHNDGVRRSSRNDSCTNPQQHQHAASAAASSSTTTSSVVWPALLLDSVEQITSVLEPLGLQNDMHFRLEAMRATLDFRLCCRRQMQQQQQAKLSSCQGAVPVVILLGRTVAPRVVLISNKDDDRVRDGLCLTTFAAFLEQLTAAAAAANGSGSDGCDDHYMTQMYAAEEALAAILQLPLVANDFDVSTPQLSSSTLCTVAPNQLTRVSREQPAQEQQPQSQSIPENSAYTDMPPLRNDTKMPATTAPEKNTITDCVLPTYGTKMTATAYVTTTKARSLQHADHATEGNDATIITTAASTVPIMRATGMKIVTGEDRFTTTATNLSNVTTTLHVSVGSVPHAAALDAISLMKEQMETCHPMMIVDPGKEEENTKRLQLNRPNLSSANKHVAFEEGCTFANHDEVSLVYATQAEDDAAILVTSELSPTPPVDDDDDNSSNNKSNGHLLALPLLTQDFVISTDEDSDHEIDHDNNDINNKMKDAHTTPIRKAEKQAESSSLSLLDLTRSSHVSASSPRTQDCVIPMVPSPTTHPTIENTSFAETTMQPKDDAATDCAGVNEASNANKPDDVWTAQGASSVDADANMDLGAVHVDDDIMKTPTRRNDNHAATVNAFLEKKLLSSPIGLASTARNQHEAEEENLHVDSSRGLFCGSHDKENIDIDSNRIDIQGKGVMNLNNRAYEETNDASNANKDQTDRIDIIDIPDSTDDESANESNHEAQRGKHPKLLSAESGASVLQTHSAPATGVPAKVAPRRSPRANHKTPKRDGLASSSSSTSSSLVRSAVKKVMKKASSAKKVKAMKTPSNISMRSRRKVQDRSPPISTSSSQCRANKDVVPEIEVPTFAAVLPLLEKAGFVFRQNLYCRPNMDPGNNCEAMRDRDYFDSEQAFRKNLCAYGMKECTEWQLEERELLDRWVRLAIAPDKVLSDNHVPAFQPIDARRAGAIVRNVLKFTNTDMYGFRKVYLRPGADKLDLCFGYDCWDDDSPDGQSAGPDGFWACLTRFGLPQGVDWKQIPEGERIPFFMFLTENKEIDTFNPIEFNRSTNMASFGSKKRKRTHEDASTVVTNCSTADAKRAKKKARAEIIEQQGHADSSPMAGVFEAEDSPQPYPVIFSPPQSQVQGLVSPLARASQQEVEPRAQGRWTLPTDPSLKVAEPDMGLSNYDKLLSCRRLLAITYSVSTPVVSNTAYWHNLNVVYRFICSVIQNQAANSGEAGEPAALYICGTSGIGKTLGVKYCCEQAQLEMKEANGLEPSICYVNANHLNSSGKAMESLLENAGASLRMKQPPKDSKGLCQKLKKARRILILIIDEMDALVSTAIASNMSGAPYDDGGGNGTKTKANEDVIQQVLEWSRDPKMPVAAIGISNSFSNSKYARLQQLGTFYKTITFKAYGENEIYQILQSRVGTTVFETSALRMIAKKIASCGGDVRKAMELASSAVTTFLDSMIAEQQDKDMMSSKPFVTIRHVNTAIKNETTPKLDLIRNQSLMVKAVLIALLELTKHGGTSEWSIGDLRNCAAESVQTFMGGSDDDVLPIDDFLFCLDTLVDQDILSVTTNHGTTAKLSEGTTVEVCHRKIRILCPLDDVRKAVEMETENHGLYQRVRDTAQKWFQWDDKLS